MSRINLGERCEKLDFTLKGLNANHPYLRPYGLTQQTVDHFELGYAPRGFMQERIAIPLRDSGGELIGYAGRIVNHPLATYQFSQSLFLYNGYMVTAPANDLVVVEGFTSVWWLWQNGHTETVGLMGPTCSSEQAALIVGMVPREGRVWVFTDGNQAGRYCAQEVLRLITPYRFCRWIHVAEGRQPINYGAVELDSILR